MPGSSTGIRTRKHKKVDSDLIVEKPQTKRSKTPTNAVSDLDFFAAFGRTKEDIISRNLKQVEIERPKTVAVETDSKSVKKRLIEKSNGDSAILMHFKLS